MDVHNKVRRDCGMPDLVWDEALATQAGKNAQSCVYAHSAQKLRPNSGENIASGTNFQPGPLSQLWAD